MKFTDFFKLFAPSTGDINQPNQYNREPVRLAGTGTTEAATEKLQHGRAYKLKVGGTAVRVTFLPSEPTGSDVATTSLRLAAGDEFVWTVDQLSQYVAIEEDSTSAGYEAWVWKLD